MNDFNAGLIDTYKAIEILFNSFRKTFPKERYELPDKLIPIITPSNGVSSQKKYEDSRATLILDNGYALKIRPRRARSFDYIDITPVMSREQAFQEETNVNTLTKYGFTQDRGFTVPEHKVIGLYNHQRNIKVNPNGRGITITEDLTEGGLYTVKGIELSHFKDLENKKSQSQQSCGVFN